MRGHQSGVHCGPMDREAFLREIAKGFTYLQATENLGLDRVDVETELDDSDFRCEVVDVAIVAGANIRAGKLPVPDRYDGLYDKFRN